MFPEILDNIDKIDLQMEAHQNNTVRWVENLDKKEFRAMLEAKALLFKTKQEEISWLSFNFRDSDTKRELSKIYKF